MSGGETRPLVSQSGTKIPANVSTVVPTVLDINPLTHLFILFFKVGSLWATWVAQSVKYICLQLSSGHDSGMVMILELQD